MADCGASGTALDQAARAFIGNNTNAAHQAQEQLLRHATLAGGGLAGSARQETLTFPSGVGGDVLLATSIDQQHQGAGIMAAHHDSPATTVAAAGHMMTLPVQQQQMAVAAVNFRIQHQQHMTQHMMMMQKHQYVMLQQQQQQHQELHMQAKGSHESAIQQGSQGIDREETNEAQGDNDDEEGNVHGASIEELAAAWSESLNDDNDDPEEGPAQGASIEELAAAWAEAQDEYYGSEPIEDPSDLFSEETIGLDVHEPTYQFVNDISRGNEIPKGTVNFMEEGMHHFRRGDLAVAIRNFELEIQLHDKDNSIAWRMLGKCHAENDQDREAIICLETAVDRDPYCSESMLALGVSYVNELNHAKALAILKEWITMNPKYAGMDVSEQAEVYGDEEGGNDSDFQELQTLLLQALEVSGDDALWEALGVAANVSRDYETAIDAFRKAIQNRPGDYSLWNKLGATLANSNRSDQALPAYHKAIELKPKYARAWLNLAISHSNLRQFDEAARCYLQTLSLNPGAVHCWSYLRVALSCSEKWDLIPFAASQNLEAFKEHYDFV